MNAFSLQLRGFIEHCAKNDWPMEDALVDAGLMLAFLLPTHVLFVKALLWTKCIHRNSRLLMSSLTLAAALVFLSTSSKIAFYSIGARNCATAAIATSTTDSGKSNCSNIGYGDLERPIWWFAIVASQNFAVTLLQTLPLMILAEKIIATAMYKTYEKSRRSISFIIVFYVVQVVNQVSQALFFLATGQQSILMNIRGLLCLQLLTTIFSIVLRSISHKLYYGMNHHNYTGSSLVTIRYQIRANIRTLKCNIRIALILLAFDAVQLVMPIVNCLNAYETASLADFGGGEKAAKFLYCAFWAPIGEEANHLRTFEFVPFLIVTLMTLLTHQSFRKSLLNRCVFLQNCLFPATDNGVQQEKLTLPEKKSLDFPKQKQQQQQTEQQQHRKSNQVDTSENANNTQQKLHFRSLEDYWNSAAPDPTRIQRRQQNRLQSEGASQHSQQSHRSESVATIMVHQQSINSTAVMSQPQITKPASADSTAPTASSKRGPNKRSGSIINMKPLSGSKPKEYPSNERVKMEIRFQENGR